MTKNDLQEIHSKEDFVNFLRLLSADSQTNKEEWENWTIKDYLESISAYVKISKEFEEPINWRLAGRMFLSGKYYE
jgi:hypothetical protein